MLVFPCSVILRFETGNTFSLHIEAEEKTVSKRKSRPFFPFFFCLVVCFFNNQWTRDFRQMLTTLSTCERALFAYSLHLLSSVSTSQSGGFAH